MWQDTRDKIRRFLRDPDGNIWTDGFLLRAFNDSQVDTANVLGLLQKVESLRVPPMYGDSYLYDWEYNFKETDKVYQALHYHHQSMTVCCFKWETQQQGITTGSETDEGYAYIYPFEAYVVTNVNKHSPVWFPDDFKTTRFIAWDKDPIEFMTKKEITSKDMSWKIQSGDPFAYYREDEESNEFYLYPKPSGPVFDDIDGDALLGQVIYVDTNGFLYVLDENGDYVLDEDGSYVFENADIDGGTIVDITGHLLNQDRGIATDSIDDDDNVLLIYDSQPVDMESDDDEPDLPKFLQKYAEYGALERAYSANTDGRIESLRDYWKWRKELGNGFLKQYKWSRLADRDFRLVSQGSGGSSRKKREPRLPDTYPYVR